MIAANEEIRFGWKKTLFYSLLPLLFLAGGLELGARIWELATPPLPLDYGWGFNPESRLFVPSEERPGLYITNPSKEVSFPKQSFSMPKAPDCFRMVMLGGSNVNYLFGDMAWSAARLSFSFGRKHRFEYLNAGGLSYGSHRLTAIAAEILDYDPDLVLIYAAHNEFEEVEQLQLVELKTLKLQKVLYSSAVMRFVRDRWAYWQISSIKRERNAEILANPEVDYLAGGRRHYSPEEIAQRMKEFRNNLAIILSLCREHQVAVILGTVPSNLYEPLLPTMEDKEKLQELYARGAYEEGKAMAEEILLSAGRHQSSSAENEIIRSLAKEYDVPLADVEAAVIAAEAHGVPGERLFSDMCHLNAKGKLILLETFEKKIKELF